MKKNIIPIIVAIITITVTTVAFYNQFYEQRLTLIKTDVQMLHTRSEIEKLSLELNQKLNQKIAEAPKSIELASIEQKFQDIEGKIDVVKQHTLGLRQAINPSKPDEILTIARLTDEINGLKKDLASMDTKFSTQQSNFQESILRELKSSSNSTTLILVVLVPLVLNFLYTVWKDYRGNKDQK